MVTGAEAAVTTSPGAQRAELGGSGRRPEAVLLENSGGPPSGRLVIAVQDVRIEIDATASTLQRPDPQQSGTLVPGSDRSWHALPPVLG